jgi:catechol 2,3-dioxygenase-like lactoylglutathione lyase family enzyme
MIPPTATRVSRFVLVVSDPSEASAFFETAFDAVPVGAEEGDAAYAALLGLPGARTRQRIVRIGEQEIGLLAFDPPGRPYPSESGSTDLWFQHFAIIVSDMEAAYARLRGTGRFAAISDGPQVLPPATGSVSAFKFRDLEGHPLELLAFPVGRGPAYWEAKRASGLFLGIDHSAVAVGDTAHSRAFFEATLGLRLGSQSENQGPEQSRMDAVPNARVTVSGLLPVEAPPHVELLGYTIGPRRPIDAATTSADIAATHLVLETGDLAGIVEAMTEAQARFISPGIVTLADGARAIMVLDPDGHRIVVRQRA